MIDMPKKVKIHEFDPVVYPFKIWIVIDKNLLEIGNNFLDSETMEKIKLHDIENISDAFIYDKYVISMSGNKNGFLVVFKNKKACNVGTMAHETVHLIKAIWDYLFEKNPGEEAEAYLFEWVIKCMDEIRKIKNT
jgi:hypothetical protein